MRWTHILTIVIALFLLAACGPRRAQVEPPRPTITPVPTFTLTPAAPAAEAGGGQNVQQTQTQVQPAATAVPAATPTPEPPMVTIGTTQMNVRAGPSLLYLIIGQAYPGEEFEVTGKNPGLGDWWEIKYRSEEVRGWVYSQLVVPRNTQNVAIAAVIPAEPTRTPTPPPTATPIPAPTQPPAPQYKWFIGNRGDCHRNEAATIFKGFVVDRAGGKRNDMCVHVYFFQPRQTVCTGCPTDEGKPQGVWEFTPFGGPGADGKLQFKGFPVTVEIYMVNCPAELQVGQRGGKVFSKSNFAGDDLTPISEKWVRTLTESTQCNNIDFQER